ncbi:unnamed protein product [Paramecium primaurelia]|uniref:Uncharacterized protein n=1 Tax=Paramecium primaurelia TaxID=5886 RepID=A0A8S1P7J5_PARPR|nr:unnamed protein product [Paramecium primaurelia]
MGAICSCKCCGCSKQKQNPPQPPPKETQKPVLVIQPKPEPKPEPEPKKDEPKKEEPIKEEPKKEESFLPPEIEENKQVKEEEKPIEVQKVENISQPDKDIEQFDQALKTIIETEEAFKQYKKEIEEQLSACFKQDQYKLKDCSEKPYSGPKIANRNICDIEDEDKYDFSKVTQFQEYNEDITLVRLIQKQRAPICTYLGKIQGKYCCVKLIPMAKKAYIHTWIARVKETFKIQEKGKKIDAQMTKEEQNQIDLILTSYFQKYFYYKIEEIKNEPEYCNCYIITKLEQFNSYTFSHHPSKQLAERINVAYQAIQIISLVQKSQLDMDQKARDQKLSAQIFQKMVIVKGNNILISRDQNQVGNYKLLLSDWQLFLDEFEVIIPNKKIQNQDKYYKNNEKCIQYLSGALQVQKDQDYIKNVKELDDVTKRFVKMIFFRVNFELLENVELKGFKNESEFIKVGKNISEIEKKKKIEYENLKTAIQNSLQKQDNKQDKKQNLQEIAKDLQNQLSQLLSKELGLYNSPNSNLLYLIYLMIEILSTEAIRPFLKDLNIDHHLKSQEIKK